MQKLILTSKLSPGDIMTMTVAVESLHRQYPCRYLTDVRCFIPEIWWNNPHITSLKDDDPDVRHIEMHYPQVHRSNQTAVTFINCYTEYLGEQLGLSLQPCSNVPLLYLSDEELADIGPVARYYTKSPYWVINAGLKHDFTTKGWPLEYYQAVVTMTTGRIQWVQIGAQGHDHPRLDGVIDLVGKTTHRELMQVVRHSCGGLGPATYLAHLCAAFHKPYICILGGREPVTWLMYPMQHTLHTIGALDCCTPNACWKSKVIPDRQDPNASTCVYPLLGFRRPVPKCMALIKPEEVVQLINRIHHV
jgi:ADP-heptose:LPS heptosyltransferase